MSLPTSLTGEEPEEAATLCGHRDTHCIAPLQLIVSAKEEFSQIHPTGCCMTGPG